MKNDVSDGGWQLFEDIQYNFKYKEFRRCPHCCEKKIKHHQNNHVYEIPQALDDNFPKKWVVKIDDEKCNKFHVEFLEQLAVLIGKLDIYIIPKRFF